RSNADYPPSKADDSENAVYDLKAVNPHRKAEVDRRTPTESIDLVEAKGLEIGEALKALRALYGGHVAFAEEPFVPLGDRWSLSRLGNKGIDVHKLQDYCKTEYLKWAEGSDPDFDPRDYNAREPRIVALLTRLPRGSDARLRPRNRRGGTGVDPIEPRANLDKPRRLRVAVEGDDDTLCRKFLRRRPKGCRFKTRTLISSATGNP